MKIFVAILLFIVLAGVIAFALIGVLVMFSDPYDDDKDGREMRVAFDSIFALEKRVRDTAAYPKTAALFKTLTDTLLDIEQIMQETPSNAPEDER